MLNKPINKTWVNDEGFPDGGVSTGIGFTIAWQRGRVDKDWEDSRNGAFLIEVLEACKHQLDGYQNKAWACQENTEALAHLNLCIYSLKSSCSRREAQGILGTHQLDPTE
jgi:hypothetical protein